jgi:hypothetical protein
MEMRKYLSCIESYAFQVDIHLHTSALSSILPCSFEESVFLRVKQSGQSQDDDKKIMQTRHLISLIRRCRRVGRSEGSIIRTLRYSPTFNSFLLPDNRMRDDNRVL